MLRETPRPGRQCCTDISPVLRTMCRLTTICAVMVCLSANAAQQEVPRKIKDYLKATEDEAGIPLWDLEYEPNRALVFGTFRESMRVGKLGFVPRIKVHQIIDENSARVALKWRSPLRYQTDGPNGKDYYKF